MEDIYTVQKRVAVETAVTFLGTLDSAKRVALTLRATYFELYCHLDPNSDRLGCAFTLPNGFKINIAQGEWLVIDAPQRNWRTFKNWQELYEAYTVLG